MNKQATTPLPTAPLGVIDTLSAGLAFIGHRPWVLLLPILVDLFFWLAPPLQMSNGLVERITAPLSAPAAADSGLTGEMQELEQMVRGEVGQLNLWTLGVSPFLFWPTVLAGQGVPPAEVGSVARGAIALDDPLLVLGGGLALSLGGLWLNVLWIHLIVRALRGSQSRMSGGELLVRVTRDSARLLGFALLMLMLMIGLVIPVSFVLALVGILIPGVELVLAGILFMVGTWLSLWIAFHLYFTAGAVVLANLGFLQAPWSSIRLVRRYFGSAMGLIVISFLLNAGFQLLWAGTGSEAAARATSIVGNAALGTALTAAMLIFFAQRYPLLLQTELAEAAGKESQKHSV